MPARADIANAAVLGFAGGMRTFVPPAALALRRRILDPPLSWIVAGTALGEMAADKHPAMESRLGPPGIAGRLTGSGIGGLVLAGPAGAAVCAAVAMVTAQACARARGALAGRLGSDLPGAVAEDLLSAGLAAYATR